MIEQIGNILHKSGATYSLPDRLVTFTPDANDKQILNDNQIILIPIQNNQFQIDVTTFDFDFYWTEAEYLRRVINNANPINRNIFIYNNNAPRWYIHNLNNEFNNHLPSNTFYFSNSFTLSAFIQILKDKSKRNDDDFHFIDNYDETSKIFLITSSKEPGKLLLPIYNEISDLRPNVNKSNIITLLNSSFEPGAKSFPIFLKNEIYRWLKPITEATRIESLFLNFEQIYLEAEKNFQTYLHDLSIDTIKKEYDEYKKNYFELISEVIGKITNQFIALPITIAAAAFAIVKVEESLFAVVLIVASLIGTSIYLSYLLKIHNDDLTYFKKTIESDYKKLLSNKFFTKHSDEIKDFKNIKDNLNNKIDSFKILVRIFFALMWIFNFLLILLLLYMQLKLAISTIYLTSSILFFILIAIYLITFKGL